MEGDGHIKDWLVQTGKDIGKVAGAHLKKAAKDKAVSYAQELIGKGLADELGAAAKSVGASALGAAASKVSDVKDVSSAKAAAAHVGKTAAKQGLSSLSSLADKYFGGAGTPEQAVRVCAYTLGSLRKIVTAYRRDMSKLSVNEFLRLHAKRAVVDDDDYAKNLSQFLEKISRTTRKGGHSMKQKRRMVTAIRRQLHPPVSKMSRRKLCEYIYGTTREMDVDWQPYFEHAVERKRIPKGCYSMPGPGVASYSEPKKVKAPKAKKSGKMSAYNKFVQSKMRDKSFWAKHSGTTHKQKMGVIAKAWKQQKSGAEQRKDDEWHEKNKDTSGQAQANRVAGAVGKIERRAAVKKETELARRIRGNA